MKETMNGVTPHEMIRVIQEHAQRGRYGPKLDISEKVLQAMGRVPRHEYVRNKKTAYWDQPSPIECDQTISQPFIVAYMTHSLDIHPEHKVLEIGMGSGYGASVIAELATDVYAIERIPELYKKAIEVCNRLGYNIKSKCDNGYEGWEEESPFDRIMVTALSNEIPSPLVNQLKIGGKMVIPHNPHLPHLTKNNSGHLHLITKTGYPDHYVENLKLGCKFVPLLKEQL
jgi:protein-L-isoaspartate(D-aspartate) O-methyltransferase